MDTEDLWNLTDFSQKKKKEVPHREGGIGLVKFIISTNLCLLFYLI